MRLQWAQFKELIDLWGIKSLVRYTPKVEGKYAVVWVNFEGQAFEVNDLKEESEVAEFEAGYLHSTASAISELPVKFSIQTPDQRGIVAVNRVPPGFTIYPTGAGDNVANNTYGNGEDVLLDKDNPTREFQFLHHFYAIGGRAVFEGCDVGCKVNAWLYAPASTGWTQATGDFDKVVVVPGVINKLRPAAGGPGTGAWNVDLAAKHGATTILKSTPVPSSGNVGWFDYNSDTNVLTPNPTQTGGYDLYDFNINLFKFGNQLHGSKLDGMQYQYEATDVVGKLLFNAWKIKFTLSGWGELTAPKVGCVLITAAKKNL